MPSAPESPAADARASTLEVVGLACLFALAAATVFASWDVRHELGRPTVFEALVASALLAIPTAVLFAALVGAAALALQAAGARPSRRIWTASLAGLVALLFAAVLAWDLEAGALGIVLAALAAGLSTFLVLSRTRVLTHAGRPQALALAVLGGALGFVISESGLRSAGLGSGLARLAALVVPAGLLIVAWLGSRRRPIRCAIVLAAVLSVALGGFGLVGPAGARMPAPGFAPRRPAKPNVVVIVLDTTRRDALGCYGAPAGTTPVLDAIAAEGVVYERAFAPSHWTVPSHASLMTGTAPPSHECSADDRLWLDDSLDTLAERLQRAGYDTAAFFSNSWLGATNMLQGFETRISLGRYRDLASLELAAFLGLPSAWVDKGSGQAPRVLSQWLSGRRELEKPVFVFLNLLEPHAPYAVPAGALPAELPDGIGKRELYAFARDFDPAHEGLLQRANPADDRLARMLYREAIRYQDRRLGEFLEVLERWTGSDDTLLVIVSDHGENLNDDGRWGHAFDVNDTLIHVPLVIRYPRSPETPDSALDQRRGLREPGLCEMADIAPTILGLVGEDAADMTGRTLVPGQFEPLEAVYAQRFPLYSAFKFAVENGLTTRDDIVSKFTTHSYVIRTEDWKFIWDSGGAHELYDLATDPAETKNVFASEPDIAAQLEARLMDWRAKQPRLVAPGSGAPAGSVDRGALDHIDDLGY